MKRTMVLLSACLLVCASSYAEAAENESSGISDHTATYFASVCGFDQKIAGDTRSDEQIIQTVANRKEVLAQLKNSAFFKESAEMAKSTFLTFCSTRSRAEFNLYDSIMAVAQKLADEASDDGVELESDDPAGTVGFQELMKGVRDDSIRDEQIVNIAYKINSIDGPVRLTSGDLRTIAKNQIDCDAVVNGIAAGKNCNEYFEEFSEIFKAVHLLYASEDAAIAAAKLAALEKEWSNFMEETLDQTPLELWWNGRLFRKKHKGYRGFVSPPKWQQILLKPYVAVDWSGNAPDGSQVQEAVVLDIWGIKRWSARDQKWYKPIGGSIHIAASDRAEQEDWGIGLSVHFTEMHTIGITSYDGEVGVFLSFDLWKNATDKYATAQNRVDEFRLTKEEFESDPLEAFLKRLDED